VRVEYYGEKRFEKRIKAYVEKKIRAWQIGGVGVYVLSVPKECWDCAYFPCEEKCKAKQKVIR
jgi:hypothetical protein